jgi:hypothetical protein
MYGRGTTQTGDKKGERRRATGFGIQLMTCNYIIELFTILAKTHRKLRRALKLKAYIFLIAWLTIFAHNVIPHNHADENFSVCNELSHNLVPCPSDEDKSIKFDNVHSDQEVCHLSNFLFHNFSPEAFLAYSQRKINFNPECKGTKIFSGGDHSYISDHLKGTTCLRAPPAL